MPLNDGHEERLQNLEEGVSELKVGHAELDVSLRHLSEKMGAESQRILTHIDQAIRPVVDRLQEHLHEAGEGSEKLLDVADRIKTIETRQEARAALWASWKKGIVPVFTGAAAIALKELVAFIVRHL